MPITKHNMQSLEKIYYDYDQSFNQIEITNTFARQFIQSSLQEQQNQIKILSYEMKQKLLMKLQEYHFIDLFRSNY